MLSLFVTALLQLSPMVLVEDTTLPWNVGLDQFSEQDVLVIKGLNPNPSPQLIIIRIDDENSNDYYSRTNLERKINSGPFELRISALGLKKENKQSLDISNLRKLFIFKGKENSKKYTQKKFKNIRIHSVNVEQSVALPDFIQAYDFGSQFSEVLEGAVQISLPFNNKPYSEIQLFGQMTEIERPGPDPWIRDGIAGIEELKMPLESGFWRIVIFREDIGEWENLPRQMDLRLAINGIEQQQKASINSASQWYQQHYLKFYNQVAKKDPWQDIVQHRGLVQSYDFEQESEQLSIALLGDSPQQRYISGIILQRLDKKVFQAETNGLNLVNARRENYFRQHWLVEDEEIEISHRDKKTIHLTKGEGRLVEFNIKLSANAKPTWSALFSKAGGYVEVRQALPRWRREGSALHLKKRFTHLTELNRTEIAKGAYKISIWLQAGELQLADQYDFKLSFKAENDEIIEEIVIDIEVLDMTLPKNTQNVGIYLDHSPHLSFFKEWKPLKLAQVYCDLNYLDRLNLRALAPPLLTPTEDNMKAWEDELSLYSKFYGDTDLLAYTPYKRLKKVLPSDILQQKMSTLVVSKLQGMNVYWSIADEVLASNMGDVIEDAEQLHSANHFAKTAGHLNNKRQKALIDHLDLVLMNHGFGVDIEEITDIHSMVSANGESDKRVWLYNMPNFRLASGAFLWHSKADGYVQWHGRMPTANPYDPTDGREADYQFFYPQPKPCVSLPDVDLALFELAMGQYELRWLTWLEQQQGEAANELREEIEETLGQTWQQAEKIESSQLDKWFKQIIDLAQSLIHTDKAPVLEANISQLSGDVNEQHAPTHHSFKMQLANDCLASGRVRINTEERCE
jgi:hypothetical protein